MVPRKVSSLMSCIVVMALEREKQHEENDRKERGEERR
jgi:hypothetical protein